MVIGFIILRYVKDKLTDQYWIHCYNCIRRYYKENPILIVDDGSQREFLSNPELYKVTIINSQYNRRGELLPYIYFLENPFCDTAVILHDSVFINKYIDFETDTYRILWDFEHKWDQPEDETKMINAIGDNRLKQYYNNKQLWVGCFGGMSVISHNYLKGINNSYKIHKLLDFVTTRFNRCSFERVIAVLLQINSWQPSLLGDIKKYCQWGISFNEKDKYGHLPIIKIWTGR